MVDCGCTSKNNMLSATEKVKSYGVGKFKMWFERLCIFYSLQCFLIGLWTCEGDKSAKVCYYGLQCLKWLQAKWEANGETSQDTL